MIKHEWLAELFAELEYKNGKNYMSEEFKDFLAYNLSLCVKKQFQIDPNIKVGVVAFVPLDLKVYQIDATTSIECYFAANAFGVPCTINWKSVAGTNPIDPSDKDFSVDKIEVWVNFEKKEQIFSALRRKIEIKELKNLNLDFTLKLDLFSYETIFLNIDLKPGIEVEDILNRIGHFVKDWDVINETTNNKIGVINFYKIENKSKNALRIYMDLTSSRDLALLSLIKILNGLGIAKIVIKSYLDLAS